MMYYNLTDVTPPWSKGQQPHRVRLAGTCIEPGECADIKRVSLSAIYGLVRSHIVSVGSRPDWYVRRKEAQLSAEAANAAKAPIEPEEIEDEEGE